MYILHLFSKVSFTVMVTEYLKNIEEEICKDSKT
jgi:hypothetical protein